MEDSDLRQILDFDIKLTPDSEEAYKIAFGIMGKYENSEELLRLIINKFNMINISLTKIKREQKFIKFIKNF